MHATQMSVGEAIDLAAAHISKGNYPLADFICRDVLAVAPGHAVALNLIGVIAAQLGLHDRAIAHFEMALAGARPFLPAKDNLQKVRNVQARAPRPRAGTEQQFLVIKAWGYGFWSDVSHVLGCLLLAEITGRIPVTGPKQPVQGRIGSGRIPPVFRAALSLHTRHDLQRRRDELFPDEVVECQLARG